MRSSAGWGTVARTGPPSAMSKATPDQGSLRTRGSSPVRRQSRTELIVLARESQTLPLMPMRVTCSTLGIGHNSGTVHGQP